MRWRWPRFWIDNFHGFNYNLSWQERRNLVLQRIEGAGFGWWVVLVAGLGFLCDSFDIFAVNTVMPMLAIVYWEGTLPIRYQLAMNVSTLVGSMVGQVVFGILADVHGRKKIYGLELLVTITASLGFAASSTGVNNSMSLIGWLIFWRFLMGIGIGADYPLSAVITAEFAPTTHRARMIAAVFFCQPLGQLLANIIAMGASRGFQSTILHNNDPKSCSVFLNPLTDPAGAECARNVDRIWRLVSGLGAVPAALAIISRLTIPESVHWVLFVKNDSNHAMHMREYWPPVNEADTDSIDMEVQDTEQEHVEDQEEIQSYDLESPILGQRSVPLAKITSINSKISVKDTLPNPDLSSTQTAVAPDPNLTGDFEDPRPHEQSWKDFWQFLFGPNGSWTDLFATSVNWMIVDFTFYLLGVNSSRLIPEIFDTHAQGTNTSGPWTVLWQDEWHTLIATSIGAVLGGAIAISIMNDFSRRKIQMWGFLALAFSFTVLGVLYLTLINSKGSVVIVVFYVICQLLFNIGPNTTTFIIPAEAFPTRYRCTCYGISAAVGKLGSVLGQIVVSQLVESNIRKERLGYLFISFIVILIPGAIISKRLTPETTDIRGKSRPLEDLSLGKAHRKRIAKAERASQTRIQKKK